MTYARETEKVLAALKSKANLQGYVDNYTFPEIAHDSGVGLRSVPRHLDELHNTGKIIAYRHRGRGITNRYEIKGAEHD